MSAPDRQTREILEVTRENPHLSPKEIAARVGCPTTEVTDVLERYENVDAVDRELEHSGVKTRHTHWILPIVLGAIGLGIIGIGEGSEAPLSTLLIGIGVLSLAMWVRGWF
jgi:hypothetical protein